MIIYYVSIKDLALEKYHSKYHSKYYSKKLKNYLFVWKIYDNLININN